MIERPFLWVLFGLLLVGCGRDENHPHREPNEVAAAKAKATSTSDDASSDATVGDAKPNLLNSTPLSAVDVMLLLKPVVVKVTLAEGRITVDTSELLPAYRIFFEITNATDMPRRFVVVETDFPPDKLPVMDGRVRYFTYHDEPHRMTVLSGSGVSERIPRGTMYSRGPHRREPGVDVSPGETAVFKDVARYDFPFGPGERFVLFCNGPGHYEQGEYASVVFKADDNAATSGSNSPPPSR